MRRIRDRDVNSDQICLAFSCPNGELLKLAGGLNKYLRWQSASSSDEE